MLRRWKFPKITFRVRLSHEFLNENGFAIHEGRRKDCEICMYDSNFGKWLGKP